MASNNSAKEYCGAFRGALVLPPTDSLQCGLLTLNRTLVEPCCTGEIHQYKTCYMYCKPKNDLQDFVSCVSLGANDVRTDTFCQRDVSSIIRESLSNQTTKTTKGKSGTSSGAHSVTMPRISSIIAITLLISALLISPATASQHAASDVQSSKGCVLKVNPGYNRTFETVKVSADFACSGSSFCTFSTQVDTGLGSNDRKLNSLQAAATPKYDDFFEILGNATTPKRLWPAKSGLKMHYEWVALPGSTTWVGFTPVQVRSPFPIS